MAACDCGQFDMLIILHAGILKKSDRQGRQFLFLVLKGPAVLRLLVQPCDEDER